MNELSTFLPSLSVCIYFIHFTDYQRVRSGSGLQRFKKPASKLCIQYPDYTDKSTGSLTHYTQRSCPAIEMLLMKLLVHFCADVNARGLTLLWFLNTSTLQKCHVQLAVEYLHGKKFHKLTCCDGGILFAVPHPNSVTSLNDSFLHKCDGRPHWIYLILYPRGNRSKNTWSQRLRDLAQYFVHIVQLGFMGPLLSDNVSRRVFEVDEDWW